MDELRVPKRRVAVEVLLPAGAVRQVAVFLGAAASDHPGGERLSDLLNGGDDFIPAIEGEQMTFLNRASLVLARVAPEEESGAGADVALPTEHEVEVDLRGGARLRGLVSYVRPPERSRLIDFLNDALPFFRLFEPQRIALVNKRHVARVALVGR